MRMLLEVSFAFSEFRSFDLTGVVGADLCLTLVSLLLFAASAEGHGGSFGRIRLCSERTGVRNPLIARLPRWSELDPMHE